MRCSLWRSGACLVLPLGILVTGTRSLAAGEADSLPVYGPNQKLEGKTHAEWCVVFLQWAYGIKKEHNPILDGNGAHAGEGQSGPVWFLAGNFGGVTRRKVTVPAGKPIFMPVVYAVASRPPEGTDPRELAAFVRKRSEGARDLMVTVDGKSLGDLSKHRIATGAFLFTGPEKPADAVHPTFAGKRLVAADGYWVLLKPLPPGQHTVCWKGKCKGETEEESFRLNITYELTVAEASKP